MHIWLAKDTNNGMVKDWGVWKPGGGGHWGVKEDICNTLKNKDEEKKPTFVGLNNVIGDLPGGLCGILHIWYILKMQRATGDIF